MKTIVNIEKRSELNKYFDESMDNSGFKARMSNDGRYVHIILDNEPDTELVVPFLDIIFYAGYSSKKYHESLKNRKRP